MPTQIEEMIMSANRPALQYLLPDLRQRTLQRPLGWHMKRAGRQSRLRCGQSRPVQLAIGRQRPLRQLRRRPAREGTAEADGASRMGS